MDFFVLFGFLMLLVVAVCAAASSSARLLHRVRAQYPDIWLGRLGHASRRPEERVLPVSGIFPFARWLAGGVDEGLDSECIRLFRASRGLFAVSVAGLAAFVALLFVLAE